MRYAYGSVLLTAALLWACSTDIQPRNETIKPSKERFGTFGSVVMRPLAVEHTEGDSGDLAAVRRIDDQLRACMKRVFPNLGDASNASTGGARTLLIEPSIPDLKKVNSSERVLLGPIMGSSAVLLKVRFTNTAANDVLAEPMFYAKTNAWSGAFTAGAMDNKMLTRIVNNACDYSRQNF